MQVHWNDVARVSKVFSSPTRTATLIMLIRGKRPFEIAKKLGVTIQAVSVAIRLLERDGLLKRSGTQRGSPYHVPKKTEVFLSRYLLLVGELIDG